MTHHFNPGDKVAIINNRANGEPCAEGTATIVKRLGVDHLYLVRFDADPAVPYERFAHVRPGNEADAYLEDLRARWRAASNPEHSEAEIVFASPPCRAYSGRRKS